MYWIYLLSYLSSNFVVVQIHPVFYIPTVCVSGCFRGIHKCLTEPYSIVNIVTASSPLPAFHITHALAGEVAGAVRQVARTA